MNGKSKTKIFLNSRILLNSILYVDLILIIYSFFYPSLPKLHIIYLPKKLLILNLAFILLIYIIKDKNKIIKYLTSKTFKKNIKIYIIILFLIVLTRIPFLIYHNAFLNSDSCVTLLMIKNISNGESFPIYFYGQLYQGSLNSYISSLFYFSTNNLKLSVIFCNILFFSLFVFLSLSLINKITNSTQNFYTISILSLPITILIFYSLEYIRSYALIIFLEILLIFCVYQIIFNKKTLFFGAGLTAGILLWIYQPSLSIISISLISIAIFSLFQKKIKLFINSISCILLGFIFGNFVHILAEINNGFINTKAIFLPKDKVNILTFFKEIPFFKIIYTPVTDLDANIIISTFLSILFILGLLMLIYQFLKEKSFKWLFLPSIFFVTLLLVSLSGYPPTPRFIIHYKCYSFFTILIIALSFKKINIFNKKAFKTLFLVCFIIFSIFKTNASLLFLKKPHKDNTNDIRSINKIKNNIIVGNYWNTSRISPFLNKSKIITPAPYFFSKSGMFKFSKYHFNNLRVGDIWSKEKKTFISTRKKEKSIDEFLGHFDINFTKMTLPSKRYILYSDFSKKLSPYFYSILTLKLNTHFVKTIADSYTNIKNIFSKKPEIKIKNNQVILSIDDFVRHVKSKEDQKPIKDCRFVLINKKSSLSFPITLKKTSYSIPNGMAFETGKFKKYIYFLNIPIIYLGESVMKFDINKGTILTSNLSDSLLFGDPAKRNKNVLRRGIPINNTKFKILKDNIDYLEFDLYSFFNFTSAIWTNTYNQYIFINNTPFYMKYGKNNIKYNVKIGEELILNTKYKTFFRAKDSADNIIFVNTGVILERIIIHRKDLSIKIIKPFLN